MANETYIVASLEDEQAKQLGQIISNANARAILSLLAKKRATESEMANELKLPLSTVNYNIKQLLKTGLITIAGSYYSKKGNRVNVYGLAKKFILIAPKGVSISGSKIKSILATVLIIAGIAGLIKLFFSRTFARQIAEQRIVEAPEAPMAAIDAALAPEAPLALQATHYALFFLVGALIALGLYLLFSWRRR